MEGMVCLVSLKLRAGRVDTKFDLVWRKSGNLLFDSNLMLAFV